MLLFSCHGCQAMIPYQRVLEAGGGSKMELQRPINLGMSCVANVLIEYLDK